MNFLAHTLLARANPELLLGGILGDFVKGDIARHHDGELARGIRLHRRIDA